MKDEMYLEYLKQVNRSKEVYYTYIHTDGKRFSCHAPNIEEAKIRRDKWIEKRERKKG